VEWACFTTQLSLTGLKLTKKKEKLKWEGVMYNEQISVKEIYKHISHGRGLNDNVFWFHNTWRWDIPLKLKCFMWLVVHNNILTWDNIHKRGFQDLGRCSLCK